MKAQWEVVDHTGGVVFSAEMVASEFAVKRGMTSAGAWAKKLARENSDPETPPLQARRVEP